MIVKYGYKDGLGDYFITIDKELCNGCRDCAAVCPSGVFKIIEKDPNDPLRFLRLAIVNKKKEKRLKYECNPCKPSIGIGGNQKNTPPCVFACEEGAISHSW